MSVGDGKKSNKRSGATPLAPDFVDFPSSVCPVPRAVAKCVGLGAQTEVCSSVTGIKKGACAAGAARSRRTPSGAKFGGTVFGDAAARVVVLTGVP